MDQKTKRMTVSCHVCQKQIVRNVRLSMTQAFFCSVLCKAEFQTWSRPIGKDDLRRMYLDEGMSAVDIAKIVSRDAKSVWNWLKWDEIPTRPRGSDERQHFAKGHKLNFGMKMPDSQRAAISAARKADGSKSLFRANGDHVLKGVKGDKHPSWKGGCTPLRNAFYSSNEWKAACVKVWDIADAKCELCGLDHRTIDRTKIAFHIHHIASFSIYPDLRADPENLKLLCAPCHRWVHSRKNTENLFIKREPRREKTRV